MVILTISVHVRPNKRKELLSTCRLITEQTRKQKGCKSSQVFQDIDNDNLINFEETWEHRKYLDEHFCSDIFSALMGAVRLLGETHELRINDGSQDEGMEAVKAAQLNKDIRAQ